MAHAMFEGWGEFFFMVGSSAAALIGLMFVVVTLTAGRDRDQIERGKHLYTSPIVWHLAVVLLLSGAAIAPTTNSRLFGVVAGVLALLGFAMGLRSAIGIQRYQLSGPDSMFDMWWYGIVPAVVYVGIGAAAAAVLSGASWAATAVGAGLMALLLVSIHAEWDLVTFLAPLADPPAKRSTRSKKR
jgi:predicted neutral ceramidase superfamily lipid hydrolase